jgi:hypothetical protein
MHRCRHPLEKDPYPSGPENRRENRDRLSRDIALHDSIRRAIRRGYEQPYGGHMAMPGYLHGLGDGSYVPAPPFCPYGGHYGYPGIPGSYVKGLPLPVYTDGYDSDDECPPTWHFPPPPRPPHPHLTTSLILTSRRPRRSRCGGRYGPGLSGPCAEAFEHEHYHIPPRHYLSHMGRRH